MMTRRSGMTLIELIVGMAIASIVVSVGYAAFSSIIDRRANAADAARTVAHAVGLRRTLIGWLDGSTPRIPQGVSDPSVLAELQVQTRNPTPFHSPMTTLALYVDNGSDGYGHGLVAILHPSTGTDSMRVMLDTTITSMTFEYGLSEGGIPEWTTEDQVGSQQPIAIAVLLQSSDPAVAAELARPIIVPTGAVLK